MTQVVFIPGIQNLFNIQKFNCIIHLIKKLKKKNHIVMSVHAEKTFGKIQCLFMIKTLQQARIEEVLPQLHTEKCKLKPPVTYQNV